MTIKTELLERAESKCEFYSSADDLKIFVVGPYNNGSVDQCSLLCAICRNPERSDIHHWRCLLDNMWTPFPAVQVLAWRMLDQLTDEAWARDLLEMLYLDGETESWAKAGKVKPEEKTLIHKDSSIVIL